MFRFPLLHDPRAVLFGITLFSQNSPGLEKQLEVFANMLEATRNSLSVIRGEMHNFEASLFSSLPASKTEFSTKPVGEQPVPITYTNPNQPSFEPTITLEPTVPSAPTVDAIEEINNQLEKQLDRLAHSNPDSINEFLNDLERLIRKYR
ncbi:hypothetical protein Dred_1171 [Desulforamulus reducens MI-1]|uniref:Uncharacterized protein n=1 Tax=Desulforamulus reducens (strain ATCC BAA-1160 / DSM 100696 / MI-1) TaxID=349161 RepID=A4J3Q2_DESRM|nr:hypothetical protein [Desulforamulus reducens]ABO49705.1 hypothetical protein Dred_1171 [Desulforamulus reducens MI-1]